MAETTTSTSASLPANLEPPPRTTGNSQQDFPLVVDWMWKAYQVINQSVTYISSQVDGNTEISLTSLPDPATSTIAVAQQTANAAYTYANTIALQIEAGLVKGTVTISDANTSGAVTFSDAQTDTEYVIMLQAKSASGTPATDAYTISSKSYSTTGFSFTILAAPGVGTSITFDWQLVRDINV